MQRLEAAKILHDHNIRTCFWAEDAVAFYGVPTVVFELYLLVPDEELQKASAILSTSPGFHHVPPNEQTLRCRHNFIKYWSYRYIGQWSNSMGVQLLPAQEFAAFTINEKTTITRGSYLYPKLPDFIEALVHKYLEPCKTVDERGYLTFIRLYLLYLSSYAVDRYSVLDKLSPKARLLWSDILEEKLVLGEEGLEMYRKG